MSLFCACQYFAIQLNIFWNSIIIFKEKKVSFFTIIKCYSNRYMCTNFRLHTGGVELSFLDRLIFLHSWWESNETFLGVASVISRPATCQVSIAGEHLFVCVSMEVVLSWKLCLAHPPDIRFDFLLRRHTCFVYPRANRTLLLQERTGHLGAQPVETHVYPNFFSLSPFFCFVHHFEFSSGLPLYTSSKTPVPGSPSPVPRSPFLVLVTSSRRHLTFQSSC